MHLLRYLKQYKKESVLAPLFKMLEALLDLFIPLIMADIINNGIAASDSGYIIRRCILMIALGLIGLAFSITAQYFSARAAVGASADIRHSLFDKIQSLGFSETDVSGTSTLINRMTSDVNQVQNGLNLFLRLFLRSPFVVFGAMILAFTINVKAALIFVVTIPILGAVVFGIMLKTAPKYKRVQAHLDQLTGITRENLTGARVVRAFGREEDEVTAFRTANGNLTKSQLNVGRISALLNPLTYVIINLAIVVLLQTGAVQVDLGTLAMGDVVALINYMNQILLELIKLANLVIQLTKATACAERIDKIFAMTPAMCFGDEKIEPDESDIAVSFSHVSLTYAGAGGESLTDLTFSARKGQTIGVIGGTGSGKTSLISLIPRYYDATAGNITLFGKDIRSYDRKSLRGTVGTVMQRAQLFSGTIRSNLLWGNPQADDDALWRALTIAQAADVVRSKSQGLDEPVEQSGRNFSGGQKQRLSIARSLVAEPKILIFDDSASALDYATDAALRKALRTLPDDMTVFIVSQRATSLMGADQIIVLDEGKMVGCDTHEKLLQTCPVYRDIYESQFRKADIPEKEKAL